MKKVVTIGGGTGSYAVLHGLKQYPLAITAITTMFDSGSSSRILRDEFGVLPPGDVRRCLLALSEGKREQTLRDLFVFRFDKGSSLNGHSFGNLLLTALTSIYGNDVEAIKKASEILNVNGTVLPVSLDKAEVHATLEDGSEVVGEDNIDVPQHDGSLKITNLRLEPCARLYDETRQALEEADFIVIAPGDMYSSRVPILLVEGVKEAIAQSSAKTILVMNLMTKWGETHGFAASDFARVLAQYAGIEKFDYVICDDSTLDPTIAAAYAEEKQFPISIDDALSQYARTIIRADITSHLLTSDADAHFKRRHDSAKLAKVINDIVQ